MITKIEFWVCILIVFVVFLLFAIIILERITRLKIKKIKIELEDLIESNKEMRKLLDEAYAKLPHDNDCAKPKINSKEFWELFEKEGYVIEVEIPDKKGGKR